MIKYVLQGDRSLVHRVEVKTSIQNITFVNSLEIKYYSDINTAYDIYVLLRIINAEGLGVPGKSLAQLSVYIIYIYIYIVRGFIISCTTRSDTNCS